MKPIWEDMLTENDKKCLANQPSMSPMRGLGKKPALAVIDMQIGICGKDMPIHEHQKEFPSTCGTYAWSTIRHLQKLLPYARAAGIPIVYSRNIYRPETGFVHPETYLFRADNPYSELVPEVYPEKGDMVIEKNRASLFFQTPLIYWLLNKGVDSLLVTGNSTSGCVRATVIDSTGYMFKTAVIEECVFDRLQMAHKASMFDMSFKYCDVFSLDETYTYIDSVRHWQENK